MGYFSWSFAVRRSSSHTMSRKAKASGSASSGSALAGLTVAISGTLSMDRKKFTSIVEGAGGSVAGSVTKKVRAILQRFLTQLSPGLRIAAHFCETVPLQYCCQNFIASQHLTQI
jgi:enamine deaminase RidA (YjgF/YER057c/UK114 family)